MLHDVKPYRDRYINPVDHMEIGQENTLGNSEKLTLLRDEINSRGFFPDFVFESLLLALGQEELIDYFIHHEATFSYDSVGRHMTVLALTETRLIASHTDEKNEDMSADTAINSTDAVPLRELGAVTLSRVMTQAHERAHGEANGQAHGQEKQITETWLTLGWQTTDRIDLQPATCSDPKCEADHGYTGISAAEDMVIRVSPSADGKDAVDRLIRFGSALQRRIR